MANLLALFKPKVKVYDLEPLPEYKGDGAIKGRQVALWRPPVMLDQAGRTMPGVSKELIAHYLVATTSALARQDLGPVSVEWGEQQGRFATTELTIHAWSQTITIMHPVAAISQDLANALEHYRAGMAYKVRELHKGHQQFDEANAAIQRAIRKIEKLRDDDIVHFSDAEFLFIKANLWKSLLMSALVPVSDQEPEPVFDGLVVIGR
jgi:hypothetical protein